MKDNMERRLTDRDVQLFFDAAEKLREAAERDGDKAREATAALESFVKSMSIRLQNLEKGVSHKIADSAETTANRAAELLSAKFRQANDAAKIATEQYQEAEKKLNIRIWLYFLCPQIVMMLVFIASIFFLVTSLDEIQQRRAELSYLNEQIKNSRLTWTTCDGDKKCFRTDERGYTGKLYTNERDGSTWRIPWTE
ncbi:MULTISPECIES: hypothetical protein [Pectobacterium]|uniref:hypothetical protein n=1 Tax=Pectobacterium TaxID=122277 RepID=UPI00202D24CF|nr:MULTISPECIES: hypothetical protein [Pectobacterium]MCL6324715.1 hypothetical protein [Pectobacterium polaris]WDF97527.1 hypothetical protein PSR30_13965 [Pectobacterium carotovorum subsp. carotovorum]